ncbi:hypothetical protein BDZ97DRAFT_1798847 [Flammula alnicola]|nr:hypothetical protein BDZ97DRAFT_1798847 [Flammula alnicola]
MLPEVEIWRTFRISRVRTAADPPVRLSAWPAYLISHSRLHFHHHVRFPCLVIIDIYPLQHPSDPANGRRSVY